MTPKPSISEILKNFLDFSIFEKFRLFENLKKKWKKNWKKMKKNSKKFSQKKKISKKFFWPKMPKKPSFSYFYGFLPKKNFFRQIHFFAPYPLILVNFGQAQNWHFFRKSFGRKYRRKKKEQNVECSNFFSRRSYSTSFNLKSI